MTLNVCTASALLISSVSSFHPCLLITCTKSQLVHNIYIEENIYKCVTTEDYKVGSKYKIEVIAKYCIFICKPDKN